MDLNEMVRHAFGLAAGPYGGVAMLSGVTGAWLSLRYIAPRIYNPQIAAMQKEIDDLKTRVEPLDNLYHQLVPEALKAAKIK